AAPSVDAIVDDGDSEYSQTPGWLKITNLLSYNLDYDYHAAGSGADTATWTFDDIPAGSYQVFAHWVPFTTRATNAPFTIFDGTTSRGTVLVNQQVSRTDDQSNGVTWESLGTFTSNSGTLSVRLADNANGYVFADAVRIVTAGSIIKVAQMDVS